MPFRLVYLLAVSVLFSCQNASTSDQTSTQVPAKKAQQVVKKRYEDSISQDELLDGLAEPSRDTWQKPDIVLAALGDVEGDTIADIISGTGYFTFKMAALPSSKVIAMDPNERFLHTLEDRRVTRMPSDIGDKVEARLCTDSTAALTSKEVSAMLAVNSLSCTKNPRRFLAQLRQGLQDGGRLVLLEFKKGKLPVGPADNFKIPLDSIRSYASEAGWEETMLDSVSLPYQYMLLLE